VYKQNTQQAAKRRAPSKTIEIFRRAAKTNGRNKA